LKSKAAIRLRRRHRPSHRAWSGTPLPYDEGHELEAQNEAKQKYENLNSEGAGPIRAYIGCDNDQIQTTARHCSNGYDQINKPIQSGF
jgi:hypothetical protein